MSRKILSPELLQEMFRLRREGNTHKVIGEILHIDPSTSLVNCVENNIIPLVKVRMNRKKKAVKFVEELPEPKPEPKIEAYPQEKKNPGKTYAEYCRDAGISWRRVKIT